MADTDVVARFGKNAREEVWVSVADYHGRKIINIRVHYKCATGQWLPGKQGIALSIERYRELADAILQLGKRLHHVGLLAEQFDPRS